MSSPLELLLLELLELLSGSPGNGCSFAALGRCALGAAGTGASGAGAFGTLAFEAGFSGSPGNGN